MRGETDGHEGECERWRRMTRCMILPLAWAEAVKGRARLHDCEWMPGVIRAIGEDGRHSADRDVVDELLRIVG